MVKMIGSFIALAWEICFKTDMKRSVKVIVIALFSAGWEPEKHRIRGILIENVPESQDLQSRNCSL
jgi:hypothetical protein